MDVAKFNKDLAKMIKAATILEKHQDLTPAIKAWVGVSEMTLNASKRSDLDAAFRSMLIKKTEDIINHIKFLKAKTSGVQREKKEFLKDDVPQKHLNEGKADTEKFEKKSINMQSEVQKTEKESESSEHQVMGSNLNDVPAGFKEIKPKKDFKIITPHDPESVQKRLNQEIDYSIFAQKKSEDPSVSNTSKEMDIKLDNIDPEGKAVCFACGAENPPNIKKCENCGVELK